MTGLALRILVRSGIGWGRRYGVRVRTLLARLTGARS